MGWEAISFHMCGNYGSIGPDLHITMQWSSVAHENAVALVSSLGKDPRTATAAEMDEADARWFCGECETRRRGGVVFRKALKWRECVRAISLGERRKADWEVHPYS